MCNFVDKIYRTEAIDNPGHESYADTFYYNLETCFVSPVLLYFLFNNYSDVVLCRR